ncbi:Hypothetical predicted protein [Xyrichtys novacula]|uniref:Uncharacterized protein n=1 Tax=Xyrichtys novacula TaxID=13765 RepID=A0AAV1HI09_XYRNO|nr:Hypothetical predicted protein [Xyrichtys novacula]
MSRTLTPGKRRVTALKKQMFLTMELPTIKVIGGKSGHGDCVTGEKYVGGGGELTKEDIGDETGGTRASCGAGVKHGIERRRRDPACGWSGTGGGRDGRELEDP